MPAVRVTLLRYAPEHFLQDALAFGRECDTSVEDSQHVLRKIREDLRLCWGQSLNISLLDTRK